MLPLILSFIIVAEGAPTDLVFGGKHIKGQLVTTDGRILDRNIKGCGVNGVFYDTKTDRLASLVVFGGKVYGHYPNKKFKSIGGVVCYKDGKVEFGYFSDDGGKFNGKPVKWQDVLWAFTGGGLFIKDGRLVGAKDWFRKEPFGRRIYNHNKFSFIALTKDGRLLLGVSYSAPPTTVAKLILNRYNVIGMLRLDGGSSTCHWKGKPAPKINNFVAFVCQSKKR